MTSLQDLIAKAVQGFLFDNNNKPAADVNPELMPVKKPVTRGSKTFLQTYYVKREKDKPQVEQKGLFDFEPQPTQAAPTPEQPKKPRQAKKKPAKQQAAPLFELMEQPSALEPAKKDEPRPESTQEASRTIPLEQDGEAESMAAKFIHQLGLQDKILQGKTFHVVIPNESGWRRKLTVERYREGDTDRLYIGISFEHDGEQVTEKEAQFEVNNGKLKFERVLLWQFTHNLIYRNPKVFPKMFGDLSSYAKIPPSQWEGLNAPGREGVQADGPQVGDIRTVNGRRYILNKNHRWERYDKEEAPPEKTIPLEQDGEAERKLAEFLHKLGVQDRVLTDRTFHLVIPSEGLPDLTIERSISGDKLFIHRDFAQNGKEFRLEEAVVTLSDGKLKFEYMRGLDGQRFYDNLGPEALIGALEKYEKQGYTKTPVEKWKGLTASEFKDVKPEEQPSPIQEAAQSLQEAKIEEPKREVYKEALESTQATPAPKPTQDIPTPAPVPAQADSKEQAGSGSSKQKTLDYRAEENLLIKETRDFLERHGLLDVLTTPGFTKTIENDSVEVSIRNVNREGKNQVILSYEPERGRGFIRFDVDNKGNLSLDVAYGPLGFTYSALQNPRFARDILKKLTRLADEIAFRDLVPPKTKTRDIPNDAQADPIQEAAKQLQEAAEKVKQGEEPHEALLEAAKQLQTAEVGPEQAIEQVLDQANVEDDQRETYKQVLEHSLEAAKQLEVANKQVTDGQKEEAYELAADEVLQAAQGDPEAAAQAVQAVAEMAAEHNPKVNPLQVEDKLREKVEDKLGQPLPEPEPENEEEVPTTLERPNLDYSKELPEINSSISNSTQ